MQQRLRFEAFLSVSVVASVSTGGSAEFLFGRPYAVRLGLRRT